MTKLNSVRDEHVSSSGIDNGASSSSRSNAPPDPNRVDTILSDVFALLSLFFLTIGKSRETPATYCQIVGMRVSHLPIMQEYIADQKQIMLHMSETGAYTQEMLEPFSDRLANLKEILKRDSADGKHPEPIVRLMSRKLDGVGK